MKAILLAFAILAASAGGALAGEGGHDYFNLALPGSSRTYMTSSAAIPALLEAPVPSYAHLRMPLHASGAASRSGSLSHVRQDQAACARRL